MEKSHKYVVKLLRASCHKRLQLEQDFVRDRWVIEACRKSQAGNGVMRSFGAGKLGETASKHTTDPERKRVMKLGRPA